MPQRAGSARRARAAVAQPAGPLGACPVVSERRRDPREQRLKLSTLGVVQGRQQRQERPLALGEHRPGAALAVAGEYEGKRPTVPAGGAAHQTVGGKPVDSADRGRLRDTEHSRQAIDRRARVGKQVYQCRRRRAPAADRDSQGTVELVVPGEDDNAEEIQQPGRYI
jgi:hypothetical protein